MEQPFVLASAVSLGTSVKQKLMNVHRHLALMVLHAWILLTMSCAYAAVATLASFVKTTLTNASFFILVQMGYALTLMEAFSASACRDSLTPSVPPTSTTASNTTALMEPRALMALRPSPVSVHQGTPGHPVSLR